MDNPCRAGSDRAECQGALVRPRRVGARPGVAVTVRRCLDGPAHRGVAPDVLAPRRIRALILAPARKERIDLRLAGTTHAFFRGAGRGVAGRRVGAARGPVASSNAGRWPIIAALGEIGVLSQLNL